MYRPGPTRAFRSNGSWNSRCACGRVERSPDGVPCRLHTANFFDGVQPDGRTLIPVPLAIGIDAQLTETADATISRDRITADEIVFRYGIPCATRLRGLFDAARDEPTVREAVVAIDMMAAARLVSISQLSGFVSLRPGWRGVEQVRDAMALADEDSRSPNETRMRLIWQLDARLPRPLVNRPVFDLNGRLLGVADLLDPVAGVVVEFDGADHRRARRHSKDVAREEGFRNVDLEVCRVTGPDMAFPPRIVARFESARGRAKWLPEGQRRWTIQPPPGWPPKLSLDEHFAFEAQMRDLHEQMAREIAEATLAGERTLGL